MTCRFASFQQRADPYWLPEMPCSVRGQKFFRFLAADLPADNEQR
jgi:hypothetical protein